MIERPLQSVASVARSLMCEIVPGGITSVRMPLFWIALWEGESIVSLNHQPRLFDKVAVSVKTGCVSWMA